MKIQLSLWGKQACVKYVLKYTYNRQCRGWPLISGTDARMCLHLGRVVLILRIVNLLVLLKWPFNHVSKWELVSDSLITQLVQLESRCCVHAKTQKRPFPTTVMGHRSTTSPAPSESLLSVGPCTNKEETALVCSYGGTVSSQSFPIRCWISSYAIKHQKLAGWLITGKTMPKKDPADLYLSLVERLALVFTEWSSVRKSQDVVITVEPQAVAPTCFEKLPWFMCTHCYYGSGHEP